MLRQTKSKLTCSIVRTITTSPLIHASHYDVLGITPHATQGDIKSAYYKLSKIYHPDKNKDSDELSAKKFRAITEAYEVLGNVKLKKMYDKGLLVGTENTTRMGYQPDPEPTDPTLKFYKSHSKRQVAPTVDGRPVYNFDTWSREHYGDLFKKSQYDKELLRKKKQTQADRVSATYQESFMYLIFAVTGLFILLVSNGTTNYDKDLHTVKRKKEATDSEHTD